MRIDGNPARAFRTATSAPPISQPFRVMTPARDSLAISGARALLEQAWEAVVGGPVPARGILLLTAQWALETDAGRSMPGHNFGGIKAARAAPGADYRTVEGYGAARREVTARFRVYDSAQSGAHDYVRLLATRYPAAIDAAREGDSAGFAHALAVGGYFTADPSVYARGLERRLSELQPDTPPAPASANPAGAARELALWGLLRSLHRDPEDA